MLLLDTHVLIWLDEGNSRLGKIALQAIVESLAAGQLGVASISHIDDSRYQNPFMECTSPKN
jgi:PIN domain nuclease of toxin-antitoxin system